MRVCNKCSHMGLRSPLASRRSFYMRCSHCVRCHRIYYKTRKQKTPVKDRRAAWREEKDRQRSRDPEGFAERQRQTQARYRERHRARIRDDRKIRRTLAKEQEGVSLKTRDQVKSVNGASGVKYAAEPFRAWLWTLIREEQRLELGFVPKSDSVPKGGIIRKVAATLEVPVRRLYSWMNEQDEIDEMTLDRACSHHGGIMPWEIYERFAKVKPPTLEELVAAEQAGPVICRRPGCNEPAVVILRFRKDKDGNDKEEPEVVRRWCGPHGDELEAIRQSLEGEANAFRSRIGKKGKKSTCCRPGCMNTRVSTERYCEECQQDGWREEDYDG